jgi:hypothetical protein
MRRALFLLPLLAFTLSLTAHADTVDIFTLENGITFSVPLPPVGGNITADDFFIPFIEGNVNGHYVQGKLDLFDSAEGGGFTFIYFHVGGQTNIYTSGPQLFSGPITNPTILTGTFFLTELGFPPGFVNTLTITQSPPSPSAPEPSTLLLLTTGSLGLVSAIRRRRVVHT